MKRRLFLILAAALVLLAASCKNLSLQYAQNTGTSASSPVQTPLNSTAPPEPQEEFYGQWTIIKLIAFGPVGTFGEEDMRQIIGRTFIISQALCSCFGDDTDALFSLAYNPVYIKETVSKEDFAERNRISFEDLGITGDLITGISAEDGEGNGNGCYFYMIDNDTLILCGGGAYFELVRTDTAEQPISYVRYTNDRFGFSADIPKTFYTSAEPANDDGRQFTSADGKAVLTVSGSNNTQNDSVAEAYYNCLSEHDSVSYSKLESNWYVVTWAFGGSIAYEMDVVGTGSINTFVITYSQEQKDYYDAVISRLFATFDTPGVDAPH